MARSRVFVEKRGLGVAWNNSFRIVVTPPRFSHLPFT